MRRKFLLKVMILSLLFVALGGGDLFAQSVTEVSDAEGLKSALTKSGTVKLTGDIEVETTIGVPYVTVTLDLNGHSIKAKSDNIYPINNDGILTITDSKGNGVIEGLGLSSGFDNNTNAKGPRSAGAELFINGGTFRNLNSETGAAVYVHQGEATINGGSFYGRNIAIMSANGTVEINGGFIDGYESAIVSSASVKIKGATKISGQCRTENGGSIFIAPDVTVTYYQARIGNANNWTSYETLEDAIKAAKLGDEIYVFAGTWDKVPAMKAGITINGEVDGDRKVVLNGTLTGTLEDLTLKNLHIKGGNAQRWAYAKGDLYFDNVTFEATSVYAIHFDGIDEGAKLLYNDCTIIGWAAMGGSPESCQFIDCTIKDNGTYGVIRTYFDATIEGCTFDIRNANPNDVYQDGIHAVDANVVVTECTNIIGDNGETGDMEDIVNVSGSSIVNVNGVLIQNPAKVGNNYYATIQDAIVAAAPNGTVELRADVTVDKWIMFSESLSIGNGNIITKEINGLTINGNNNAITIKSIESAGNGNRLFYDATNLNIQDLTIECVDAAANQGGIGLTSGTISNVNFIGGVGVRPGDGDITISGCTFNTSGSAIYNEEERDNLVVTGNTFNTAAGQYAIYLRGNTTFTGNTVNTGKVNVVSGSPVVTGNNFGTERFKVYNAAEATISNNTINYLEFNDESVVYSTFTANTLSDAAQAVLDAASFMIKVSTKVELNAAINAAKDGDVIEMTADIDYGTDQLKIEKPITLDLGGKTLTTRNAYGGMSIKNNPTIKNGNIVHASNTAAIKVWNATAFEDLVIDVQGKGDANKTIGGIVLQSGTTTRVGSIKNVTIEGDALTNGIETYNCGDATENVIGSMENVNIDAVGTAMLISAPCGTATNCIFDGGVNGIEIWIKGNYSASLGLVDCDVVGGVFAHDEFNSNPEIVNNGTLNLTADEATTGAGVDDVTLTLARVEAENVDGVLEDVMEQAKAKVNNTYYQTLAEAVAAAETGSIITLMNGEHELPLFAGKELTFKGESKEGVIVNDAPAAVTQGWNGSTFHFENLTAKGATENYHGLANGVKSVTYKDCNINGLRFLYATEGVSFEGCAFNSNDEEHSFWTYGASNVTVTGCTFTYTDRAVNCYSENGADHELDISFTGCTFTYAGTKAAPEGAVEINSGNAKSFDIAFTDCTAPEKGAMWFNSQWDSKKGENTVVTIDDIIVWQVLPVAMIGDVQYKSLQAALDAAAAGTGNVTVEILRDIDLNGIDWNPVTVSEPGYPVVTVKGNSKTITGLNDMLFAGTWAGNSGLIINDLTIANSNIVNDKDDVKGTVGVGAFIGFPQASATITLNNCHLVNSTVEGGHWTGGLIGYSAGYAGNDGPVFMNLTITGCSVKESIITGKGSVGGIIGHGSGNGWTKVVIEGTTVSGNTITSTGTSNNKAGAIMGTIGAAGQPTTANGVTLTGGAMVAATVSGNTVKSNNVEITTIYGRQGTHTGMLELNGGSYDKYPIEEGVAYAKPAEGFLIKENTDGTFGVIALDGEGTEDNPYIIKDLAELIAFRDDVNGGNNYAGKYIALAADIDLIGENWTPIGDIIYNSQYKPADASKVFSGVFDGNNKVIYNLTINKTVGGADTQANVGFFGMTGEGAVIKNLTLTDVNINTDGRNVGALAGFAYKATLDNITVNGVIDIEGGNNVSGVAGMTRYYDMSATNIEVIGNNGSAIVGNNIVGGIFAEIAPNNSEQTFNNLSVENVAITGVGGVGGIVGLLTTGAVNNVTVKNVALTGNTLYQGDAMGRIRLGSVSGLMGGKYATIANVTTESVTAKNLDGNAVVLPIIGANFDASSNATEAKIGDTYYATLQTAIDAAQDGTTTINILADITGDVTILQKEGKNIVIDGKKPENGNYQFGGTIYVNGNNRHTGAETLTIQNVNFYTEKTTPHDFISANVANQYTHNVTVEGCNFATSETNVNNTVVGLRLRQAYNIAVENCTSNNIFSLMWSTGVVGLDLNKVTVNKCTEGISIGGKSQNVTITDYNITSPSFGIRACVEGGQFTMTSSTINALVPVVVRNENVITDLAQYTLSFTFNGTNNIAESNPTNYWFVAGETEYKGTSEEMPEAPKGQVSVTLNDTGLRYEDVYGNYYELAGEGTADNPYTIANLYELKFFRDAVNAGNTYQGKYVKLTGDIDLAEGQNRSTVSNWEPIGTSSNPFKGTFDGQEHTISNLVINGGSSSNQGFFGFTTDGEIKNVIFENAKVSGRLNVGVVVGTPYTSKYTNIKVTGHVEVNGMAYVGGVGGKNAYANWTDITVDVDGKSYVKATSTENGDQYRTYVGGVIGFNGEGGHTFKNISSNINVIGDVCDIGGIFGIAHYGNKFENITHTGTVTNTNSNAEDVVETGLIAGVWHNQAGTSVTFTNTNSTGTISVPNVTGVTFPNDGLIGAAYTTSNETSSTSGSLTINGEQVYPYVAKIGEVGYNTLEKAITAAQNEDVVTLLWVEGDDPISMKASLYGDKNVTIKGDATVDWSKGWLFVGRGGAGDATLIFDNANLTSNEESLANGTYGIHVSAKEGNDVNKNYGKVIFKNSDVQLSYLANRNNVEVDGGKLYVHYGFWVGGRPSTETPDGSEGTATMDIKNGAVVEVKNHNGMGVGHEGNGVMNITSSTFKYTGTSFNLAKEENSSINVYGESTIEITTLEGGSSIDLMDGAIVKNSTVGGDAYIAGNVIFRGDNTFAMISDYGDYYSQETPSMWTVEAGASLTLTKTDRYGLGYGDKVTVYGEIEDKKALTARASLTDEDASVNMYGGLVGMTNSAAPNAENSFTATNAYLIFGVNGDKSFGNKAGNYYGNYTFTFNNSVVTANGFKFYEDNGTSTVKFSDSDLLVNGVLMTNDASSSFTFENSVVLSKAQNNGTDDKNQNAGVMTLTNTQFTYSAAFTNVGTLNLDLSSKLTAPSVTGNGIINIDATNFDGNDICVISADMASFEGVINVVGAHYIKKNDGIYVTNTLQGTLTKAYTSATGYWGECGGNANESFVLKFYNDNTYMGQTSLNDIDNIIDGDVYVTWSIDLNIDPNAEGYWDMSWDIRPTLAMQPNRVEQWIDGEKVAECAVEPNWADNIFPVVAAVTGEDDVILSYVNNTTGATLNDAFAAGGNIAILRDFNLAESVTVPADKTVVLNLNGKTMSQTKACTASYQMINNKGNLTIKGNGKISFKDTSAGDPTFGWGSYTVRNEGTLVVENGTIEHLGEQNQPSNVVHMYCAIFQYSGSSTINDGTISTPTYRSARLWKGNMTINGGTFDGQVWVQCVDDTAELTINGGEFSPNGGDGSSVFVDNPNNTAGFTVTGGKFETKIGCNNAENLTGDRIIGGLFSQSAVDNTNEALLGEGFVFNGTPNANGYYTVIQIAGTQTREFANPGWYWFSTYIQFENEEVALDQLQTALVGNASMIKGQHGFTNYSTYNGTGYWSSVASALTTLSTAEMYMIRTTAQSEVELTGSFVDYQNRDITLREGWNWIGYPVSQEMSLSDAIPAGALKDGDQIKSQFDGSATYYNRTLSNGTPLVGWSGQLTQLKPGYGYMFNSASERTFNYTTDGNGAKSTLNTIDYNGENHWFADATRYPNNMTVTAMLSIDGEIVKDNYEVAAFANGECRGSARPIYIEALDAYMLFMTIQGEDVENLTFKYYDVNYGTEYELNNTMVYSNDAILGTIEEPYMFNLGILNIDETSVDQISIYPNPTTTGKEINLQAMCDKVEVFNALGVKVAEYTNVDSIDAIETAGIYVIRVTIDGNARNCRLIVR